MPKRSTTRPTRASPSRPARQCLHTSASGSEFQNATSTPYGGGPTRPARRRWGTAAVRRGRAGRECVISPYRVEIVRNVKGGVDSAVRLRNPANPNYAPNVTGAICGRHSDLSYDFDQAADATGPGSFRRRTARRPNPQSIRRSWSRANVHTAPPAGPSSRPPRPPWNVINADPCTGGRLRWPSRATVTLAHVAHLATSLPNEYRHYTVLLRRLANPNLPGPTDTTPTSRSTCSITFGSRTASSGRTARTRDRTAKMTPTVARASTRIHRLRPRTDPDLRPQSSGKIQPYAAFSAATATGLLPFPNSMVQFQDPDHGRRRRRRRAAHLHPAEQPG